MPRDADATAGTPVRSGFQGAATVGVASSLLPFQRRFVRALDSGNYNRLVLSCPRGNGKSWLASRLILRALTPGDSLFVPGYESALFAPSLGQARIVSKFVRRAVGDNPDYRFLDSAQRIGITHTPSNTRVIAIGSSGSSAMGLGADTVLAICDEPGSLEPNSLLPAALNTSLGKPRDADKPPMRIVYIGTVAPARGQWWPELVAAGTRGKTFVLSLARATSTCASRRSQSTTCWYRHRARRCGS